jgi:hypothetical protein
MVWFASTPALAKRRALGGITLLLLLMSLQRVVVELLYWWVPPIWCWKFAFFVQDYAGLLPHLALIYAWKSIDKVVVLLIGDRFI